MKTNFVKAGAEKNIEMFKMNNEELITVNGGGAVAQLTRDEDGKLIIVIINR